MVFVVFYSDYLKKKNIMQIVEMVNLYYKSTQFYMNKNKTLSLLRTIWSLLETYILE